MPKLKGFYHQKFWPKVVSEWNSGRNVLAVNVANFTLDVRLSDRFAEHLRSVRNNDINKPVARHFNAASHSISDIKVGTIHPHGLTERFSFIWSLHSFCFCLARADKSGYFSPFHSFVYVHPPPMHLFTSRLAKNLQLPEKHHLPACRGACLTDNLLYKVTVMHRPRPRHKNVHRQDRTQI